MNIHSNLQRKFLAIPLAICSVLALPALSHAQAAPHYKFDSDWPKLPLPNKWWMMGVTGLAVDKDDNVWVFDRPRDIDGTQNYAHAKSAHCRMLRPAAGDDPH